MIRCIILSDSHGDDSTLRWMLEQCWKQVGPVDCYIHCGDGAYDFRRVANFIRARDEHAAFYQVGGNCDVGIPGLPPYLTLNLEGASIFVTHGHGYRVKLTYSYLNDAAREHGCSIALFGHTHIPCMEMRSVLLVNPGSAAKGRLAVMEIQQGKPRVQLLSF